MVEKCTNELEIEMGLNHDITKKKREIYTMKMSIHQ